MIPGHPIFLSRGLLSRCMIACAALWLGACAVRADAAPEPTMHDTRITMQRTTCYGSCPSYTVTMMPNGDVSFEGHVHVQTDNARGHATPTQIANILHALEQSGFRTMRDSYTSADDGCEMMTDQPGVKITATDAAGSKTVDFYYGCTGAVGDAVKPRIEQLPRTIDQQLDTARWIGKPGARGSVDR